MKKHRRNSPHDRLRSLSTFRLDFGRHQGKCLIEVPRDYIKWMASNDCHDKAAQWIARQFLRQSAKIGA